jgi:putative Mg2+ transporter-C (MgtC) family protein
MDELRQLLDVLLSLGAAALLGGVVGLERELRGRWAGLRTHMLVSMGAALFVATSPATDVTRVIQGVAAGVGFIGAGTILKLTERVEVKGLTTASSIWLAAAVGTAAGMHLYLLAVSGSFLSVAILAVLGRLEKWFEGNEPRPKD